MALIIAHLETFAACAACAGVMCEVVCVWVCGFSVIGVNTFYTKR